MFAASAQYIINRREEGQLIIKSKKVDLSSICTSMIVTPSNRASSSVIFDISLFKDILIGFITKAKCFKGWRYTMSSAQDQKLYLYSMYTTILIQVYRSLCLHEHSSATLLPEYLYRGHP